MREVQAGVYNLLKSMRRHALLLGQFMDRVNASDEEVEGNLSSFRVYGVPSSTGIGVIVSLRAC